MRFPFRAVNISPVDRIGNFAVTAPMRPCLLSYFLLGLIAFSSPCAGSELLIYRGTYKRDLDKMQKVPKKEWILHCFLAIDPQPFRPGNPDTEEIFFSGIVYGSEGGVLRQRHLYSRTLQQAPGSSPDGFTAYIANRKWLGSSVVLAASTRDTQYAWANGQFLLKGDLQLITFRQRSADDIWHPPHYPLRALPRELSGMLMDHIQDDAHFPISITPFGHYLRAELLLRQDQALSAKYHSLTVFDAVKSLEATLEAKGYAKAPGFWR